MGDAGGAAGCHLPLARAQLEIPGVQVPNIRCKLPGFLKSCTGWMRNLEDRSLSHIERQKKVGQSHLKAEGGSSTVTDGPVQGQLVSSEFILCCWWEATPLLTHPSHMWTWSAAVNQNPYYWLTSLGIPVLIPTRVFSGLLRFLESGNFLERLSIASWLHRDDKKPQFSSRPRQLLQGDSGLVFLFFQVSPSHLCNFLHGFLYSSDSYHHEEGSSENPWNVSVSIYGGISGKFCAALLLSIQEMIFAGFFLFQSRVCQS